MVYARAMKTPRSRKHARAGAVAIGLALAGGLALLPSTASAQSTPDRTFYANGGFNVAFGSFYSSFGLNAGLQIKAMPGDHALVVGPRVFVYFPTGTTIGGVGGDIGYRGNFAKGGAVKGGILAMMQPQVLFGPANQLSLPIVGGGFFQYSNFEMQAAIGVGPTVIFDVNTRAVGLFHITAGYAW